MKVAFVKQPGGVLVPASDIEAERLTRFKTGEVFEVDIKNSRNAAFHRKVFAFFNFCFEHWQGEQEFLSPTAQFDVFRANITVLAGYHDTLINLKGEVRIEAKSISYASMKPEQFEQFYTALVNASIKHVFHDANKDVEERLLSFF